MRTQRGLPAVAGAVAVIALVASAVWAFGPSRDNGDNGWLATDGRAGTGMMGAAASTMMGLPALPGNGKVRSLDAARVRADRFGGPLDLHAGEIIEFSNGYYAEMLTAAGEGATETLIDPARGTVQVEVGPAMMWNTRYGVHGWGRPAAAARVSPEGARDIADRWLRDRRRGATAAAPEAFPGYYTLEVMDRGKTAGMLSVHATTGAVWYHTWHGRYVATSEGPE